MEKIVKNFIVLGLPVLVCIFSTANTAVSCKVVRNETVKIN